jgi:hypothetical protein
MKKTITIFTLCILCFYYCSSQDDNFKYLGQSEPTDTPKIFYLPILEGVGIERIAISNDYKQLYYTEIHPSEYPEHIIKYFNYDNGNWYGPYVFHQENNEYGPCFSPDNTKLFINGDYSVRTDSGWTTPVRFMKNRVVHYLQMTNLGNYYFLSFVNDSTTDVFKATIIDKDTIIIPLGLNMKSDVTNDYFIDPEENFILTSLHKAEIECYGRKDIFIRYRTEKGWSTPINLGKPINVENSWTTFGMCLSPDKKFMFYSQIVDHNVHVHWVRVDELFERLKEKYLKTD